MIESFILYAVLAAVGVALMSGSLGCFVMWRKMAYFGDCLAHSALLGVALGFLSGVGVRPAVMIFCSIFACLLIWLQNKRLLAIDTLLGIFAHGALSVGLVVISQMENIQIDIHSFLFGDILTVTLNDLIWIYSIGGIVLGCVIIYWNDLILMTISPDIAIAEGISQLKIHILITGLMTLMVSVSIQIVGVLLVTALLIIPAAAARFISNSPEKMAFFATFIGVLAVLLGISASVFYDTPTGPSIVTGCILLFIISISFLPIKELLMRHYVK